MSIIARARSHSTASLDRGQRRTVWSMVGVVAALHALGFFLLFVLVAPHHYRLGAAGVFAVGTGITAYALGLRHALDADHITAIDNTTRKLMAEGKRPMSVGFFFSLGHSTVVFVLAFLFALGIRALSGQVSDPRSGLHATTSWIGAGVSGTFLYAIGMVNVVILWGIGRVFMQMRRGDYDERELERRLQSRGIMNKAFGRFTRTVTAPWQMYPIGLLFGLGFDTATEVALLFLAAGAASVGLPFYAILCLPVLFAAGMTLLDTIDGSFMNFAYGWAFSQPVRKVFYNLTITSLSAGLALVIGTIEIVGLLASKLGAEGPFWAWWENVDINTVGTIVAGMFLLTWAGAIAVWRFARIEQRWSAPPCDPSLRTSVGRRHPRPCERTEM